MARYRGVAALLPCHRKGRNVSPEQDEVCCLGQDLPYRQQLQVQIKTSMLKKIVQIRNSACPWLAARNLGHVSKYLLVMHYKHTSLRNGIIIPASDWV